MPELRLPRVLAAAKEFNVGQDTLVEFLVAQGYDRDELKPTSKLTEEMYRALQNRYQSDKVAKNKADLIKGATGEEINRMKQSILEELQNKSSPASLPYIPAETDGMTIQMPELEGSKIVSKIDLSAIDFSTRPRKGKKSSFSLSDKEPENTFREPLELDKGASQIITDGTESQGVSSIKADKLEGPKDTGKNTASSKK
jgi:translation initiation factor IF-2